MRNGNGQSWRNGFDGDGRVPFVGIVALLSDCARVETSFRFEVLLEVVETNRMPGGTSRAYRARCPLVDGCWRSARSFLRLSRRVEMIVMVVVVMVVVVV